MNAIAEKLARRMEAASSLLCVGIDPEFAKLPQRFRGNAEPQRRFGEWIVDQTAEFAAAVKLNAAFYEARGAEGVAEMERTVEYVRARYPELVTICDAKRADIGNTNEGYVEAIFDRMGFDAVTLHPYLGREALEPFLSRRDKMCIVLCRTSNVGAGEFQDLSVDGEPLWRRVAECVSGEWDVDGNCALVVGATYPEEMRRVREAAPRTTFLVPGIGAQGGDVNAVVEAGLDAQGSGLLFAASRSILFSDDPAAAARAHRDEIRDAVKRAQEKMHAAR
ncbi:MAG TPA: orotidine-5'-phosphate decarboxylase [Candidatus Aquilonibacter sp.]|nr:orotidine-5'-phosphate decarboxylase [Candidatus Aquilonibacter sp.]